MEIGSDIYVNNEGYIDPYQKSLSSDLGFKPIKTIYLLYVRQN